MDNWKEIRRAILQRDKFLCQFCGKGGRASDIILEIDHITPRSAGGSDDFDNLRTLCRNCHVKRHGNVPKTSGTFSDRRLRKREKNN